MDVLSSGEPRLARITIYPFKSFNGVVVSQANALVGGALEHDRRFALRDASGEIINAKRTDAVHRLQLGVDLDRGLVSLASADDPIDHQFNLESDRPRLEAWLRQYFQSEEPLEIVERMEGGFPDDTEAPGPTIVSTATLEAVAGWFPGLSTEEIRRRFRANLEIGGVSAFWEDRLYASVDEVVRFQIGEWRLEGTNPCQRCVVPTRDSASGTITPGFSKHFARQRKANLPPEADASRFDHFYRLAVNTRPAQPRAAHIQIGDPVRILGTFPRRPNSLNGG